MGHLFCWDGRMEREKKRKIVGCTCIRGKIQTTTLVILLTISRNSQRERKKQNLSFPKRRLHVCLAGCFWWTTHHNRTTTTQAAGLRAHLQVANALKRGSSHPTTVWRIKNLLSTYISCVGEKWGQQSDPVWGQGWRTPDYETAKKL